MRQQSARTLGPGTSGRQTHGERPVVTPDGVLKVLGALWLVCVLALAVANHDALLGGHHHSGEGTSFFHRHLHGGAHQHADSLPAQPPASPADEEPAEIPGREPLAPDDSSLFIPDSLTLALATDLSQSRLLVEELGSAVPSLPPPLALVGRFYLPCAQRPPPNAPLA